MQDLSTSADVTDAGIDKTQQLNTRTWQEGVHYQFNPDDDVDYLQRQYRTRSTSPPIYEESSEANDLVRSKSVA